MNDYLRGERCCPLVNYSSRQKDIKNIIAIVKNIFIFYNIEELQYKWKLSLLVYFYHALKKSPKIYKVFFKQNQNLETDV